MVDKELVFKLRKAGWTYNQIADNQQVSKQRIYAIINNYKTGSVNRTAIISFLPSFCQLCGSKKTPHIHHIDKNTWNNKIDNLLVVCPKCHKKVEVGKIKKIPINKMPFQYKTLDKTPLRDYNDPMIKKAYQIKMEAWAKRRRDMYDKYIAGASMNEIAREYQISQTRVSDILNTVKNENKNTTKKS
jgi:predicted DNA-binding protein YlxM (UPF0122 family)